MHSLKANGKNTDMIERLRAHAASLPRDNPLHFAARTEELVGSSINGAAAPDEDMETIADDPQIHSRPSEQWEMVMDSIAEEDEKSSAGSTLVSKASKRTFKSSTSSGSTLAGEFGTSKCSHIP